MMQIPSVANAATMPQSYATDSGPRAQTPGQAEKSAAAPVVPVPPSAVQQVAAQQDGDALQDALKKLNDAVKVFSNSSSLRFSIDEGTGSVVVKVTDTSTDEVIRQIPSEEALAIAKAIDEFQGMLIQDRA
ncbi:flagellar protein FlaG [Chitiniphilus purpureus]|uniref:Flagellar protein FlaG n=1 Tax=Chitiniphilus purpureus TaxID=2981137 RepID=A0ABY6DJU4_9NEIS|nr:flagellar protein FlaG [Chitiniphilus sp. CD1]UXY13706.1 flagellar protein FlaG [Chitiniphilus sp. CD1]